MNLNFSVHLSVSQHFIVSLLNPSEWVSESNVRKICKFHYLKRGGGEGGVGDEGSEEKNKISDFFSRRALN